MVDGLATAGTSAHRYNAVDPPLLLVSPVPPDGVGPADGSGFLWWSHRLRSSRAVLGLSALTLAGAVSTGAEGWTFPAWRTESAAVEAFLRDAEVIGSEPIPVGISRPTKLTLALGELEGAAIFKTIDVFETKMEFEDGSFAINFRDSYKNELAAYELDKLLGLGLVPPTVERRLDDVTGAVRLWIEGAMTEAERQAQGLGAPDPAAWSREVAAVRLFYNLTGNTDYRNIRNLLVDGRFRICAIDHSPPGALLTRPPGAAGGARRPGPRRAPRSLGQPGADQGAAGAAGQDPRPRREDGRPEGRGGGPLPVSRAGGRPVR